MDDFEIIKSTRGNVPQQNNPIISTGHDQPGQPNSNKGKLVGAVADNFSDILRLATEITNIRKIRVQSDAMAKQMAEARKNLLAQAKAYEVKKRADTKSTVDKMNVIRFMMQDFYAQGSQQITGEDFRVIITEIVNQMCRVEHEGQ